MFASINFLRSHMLPPEKAAGESMERVQECKTLKVDWPIFQKMATWFLFSATILREKIPMFQSARRRM